MDAESIITEVKSKLETDITLKAYIKVVYIGSRGSVWKTLFPNIIIEPIDNTSIYQDNGTKESTLTLLIVGAQMVNNPEYQIIGKGTFKGVMDMEADIKSVFTPLFPDLGCECLSFMLSTIGYYTNETGQIRSVSIEAKFIYRED